MSGRTRPSDDVIAQSVAADLARHPAMQGPLPRTWQQLIQSTGKGGVCQRSPQRQMEAIGHAFAQFGSAFSPTIPGDKFKLNETPK